MSIKKQIQEKSGGEEIEFSEYENLILDEMAIQAICLEDRLFLEQFIECTTLSLNNCQLKTLDNLPQIAKMTRLELSDNFIAIIPIEMVKGLANLMSLKLAGNNIINLESLEALKELPNLQSLDLAGNPVCKVADYETKVREMLLHVEVLDSHDKEGKSVASEDDYSEGDDDGEDEDGEDEMDEEDGESELEESGVPASGDELGQKEKDLGKNKGEETTVEGNVGENTPKLEEEGLPKGMIPTDYPLCEKDNSSAQAKQKTD